jgi:chromate transporter
VAGLTGLLAATLAINLPHCALAYGIGQVVARSKGVPWMRVIKDGLAPVTVSLIVASGIVMARSADHSSLTVVISAVTAMFIAFSKRNPLWMPGAGTLISVAGAHLGAL